MSKNIEIELKFQIQEESKLDQFLNSLDFKGESRVVDVYLDTALGDLFKKGIFIRIRNNKNLDFKFNPESFNRSTSEKLDHTFCHEYNFDLPLKESDIYKLNEVCRVLNLKPVVNPSLSEFLAKNSLIHSITFDKIRKKFSHGKFEIVFDDVKNLGKYVEIEYITDDLSEIEKVKDEMFNILKSLNPKIVNVGYNELYWRKNDFDLYLQGKYLLEEDHNV